MTLSTDDRDRFALPLPITQIARQAADRFAHQQPNPAKAEQVQLNILAVSVMHDYLQMMGIATNREASDSWNPVLQICGDFADLELPGVGRLECRPVRATAQTCPIPPEVWADRIGYVVVQFDAALQEATLLGFAPSATIEELPLHQLRAPEDLFDHVYQLSQATVPVAPDRAQVNLSQWLDGLFETGWQALDALFNPAQLNFAFRGVESEPETAPDASIQRAKLIDLGIQFAEAPIVLLVELQPDTETSPAQVQIRLRVHPGGDRSFLPPDLELTVLDESGAIFLEARARTADNYIQLQFSGVAGEAFSVQVALGEARVSEEFVI